MVKNTTLQTMLKDGHDMMLRLGEDIYVNRFIYGVETPEMGSALKHLENVGEYVGFSASIKSSQDYYPAIRDALPKNSSLLDMQVLMFAAGNTPFFHEGTAGNRHENTFLPINHALYDIIHSSEHWTLQAGHDFYKGEEMVAYYDFASIGMSDDEVIHSMSHQLGTSDFKPNVGINLADIYPQIGKACQETAESHQSPQYAFSVAEKRAIAAHAFYNVRVVQAAMGLDEDTHPYQVPLEQFGELPAEALIRSGAEKAAFQMIGNERIGDVKQFKQLGEQENKWMKYAQERVNESFDRSK